MATLYPKIRLEKSEKHYDWFEVVEDVIFEKMGVSLTIPAGFTTDFSSVPQLFWWLIPPHCRASMPSVFHDYCYEYAAIERRLADKIFKVLLIEENIPVWQVWTMYYYVRALGWIRYKNK